MVQVHSHVQLSPHLISISILDCKIGFVAGKATSMLISAATFLRKNANTEFYVRILSAVEAYK